MRSDESMGAMGEIAAITAARVYAEAVERARNEGIEAGVRAGIEHINSERDKARKSRYDRRLHNTKLLLKNYRSFKKHSAGAVYNTRQARENAIDILDGLDDEMLGGDNYVESIKRSRERTMIILEHIDKMLGFYKISCEQSGKSEELRRYRVIMAMYIDDKKKTAEEIAEEEFIDVRTVYKDIKAAVKPISALIFGIDSLKTF